MSDYEILNRKQTLLIYLQGAGGHLIQRILHRVRDNNIVDEIVVSSTGDCHCAEPQGNLDTLELHHYSHLSTVDEFDYKSAVLSHYKQFPKTDSIVKMHPGDSPNIVDKLAEFLPNTEFAIIQTTSYTEELACSLMQIQKWDLSPYKWNVTKLELLNFFPDDHILKNAAQLTALNNISFEFECYLTWMVFLRSGYPTLKFDDVATTPRNKINYLTFSDIFNNNYHNVIHFCSAVLHTELSDSAKHFISKQLANYTQKQNKLLISNPVSYLAVIEQVALEFRNNTNRKYKTSSPRTTANNLLPATMIVYRPGADGQFITGIINAVESDDLDTDLIITDEGEYKRDQPRKREMFDFHADFSLRHIVEILTRVTSTSAVFSTHISDIDEIQKWLPNCKIVVSTAATLNDKLAAWINAMYKHALGVERWENMINPPDKPELFDMAIKSLSRKVIDVPKMLDALAQLPLLEQKDILISELLSSREKDIAISIQDTEVQSDMYEVPYSYIRFGDVDRFTAAINAICPLSEKAESFVRRNFNNYYKKQNHQMMHDPHKYTNYVQEKAQLFIKQIN